MNPQVPLAIGDHGAAWFLIAFSITQLVEVPIYLFGLRSPDKSRSFVHRLAIAFGASAITHPVVWFVAAAITVFLLSTLMRAGLPPLGVHKNTLVYGALSEGFAFFVEGLYLRHFKAKRPFVLSLVANVSSVLIGSALVWAVSGS
ncbi:MAG: hypothetical protein IPK82_12145 [Polyangiaceae bacterium]|nr:hypothetical protein [Polyangiaceae bacterium]